ncbi:Glycine N-acyltransferase [Heterocephalus glaber]|uniref:Glycine N-acyltransferase-like protein n=1 Tax=Heterocephalus glaber TaxID=10181 RepID=G5AP44_HETGA|nr:Glycine N-acyltransferase [Heterocephalus glaber]
MFQMQGPQMLQKLEKSLRKHLPESLKEMTNDLNHYTDTYLIYFKNPTKCQEFLGSPEVMNWKQHLQIQSSQPSLNKVIENLADINMAKVKYIQHTLYIENDTAKKLVPFLMDTKNLPPNSGESPSINQEMFKLSSLDVTHAALVNQFWHLGGNERSQRFIERCIRSFPSFCLLGPKGTPVSWSLMDHTGELRMAGTVPEYQGQGLMYHVIYWQFLALKKLGFPMYAHVERSNRTMERGIIKCQNAWQVEPVELCSCVKLALNI